MTTQAESEIEADEIMSKTGDKVAEYTSNAPTMIICDLRPSEM